MDYWNERTGIQRACEMDPDANKKNLLLAIHFGPSSKAKSARTSYNHDIALLVEKYPDLQLLDARDQLKVLQRAATVPVMQLLLQHKASAMHQVPGCTPPAFCHLDNHALLSVLLQHEPHLDVQDASGRSLYTEALYRKYAVLRTGENAHWLLQRAQTNVKFVEAQINKRNDEVKRVLDQYAVRAPLAHLVSSYLEQPRESKDLAPEPPKPFHRDYEDWTSFLRRQVRDDMPFDSVIRTANEQVFHTVGAKSFVLDSAAPTLYGQSLLAKLTGKRVKLARPSKKAQRKKKAAAEAKARVHVSDTC